MSAFENINHIITRCQKGDRSAQKALYELYAPKMFGVCLRYSGNRQAAEDFLQDGFIRVFEKIGDFRFEGSFEGWMRRIMVNLIIESFRKKKISTEITNEFPDIEDQEKSFSEEGKGYSLDELLALIQQLPERYRLVFNMYVIDEMTHEEIAQKLNISIGTSKSNLARARKWLQKKIREDRKLETIIL
ncbi:RNA polymerase sigma factor [Thermophagus xiamenensis]|uniref:RNA polymerase sigma-70 factor, ECF subfamily n=1 Tax=Thermophagus xiamenensis TaxID=385682 RepID=A0A1I1XM78_9BACT|nr:sigma-70 family RNA polymerase sigma factor [Thermophagus xiamenensis]SFE08416.1 RNA polymerase sigma-70 factor, ECF subfamily [Thermophagus xiamenensis]